MESDGKEFIQYAVKTYQKLLPNHHVATVDITSMKKLQGSLHCMSLNLPRIAPIPKNTISFAEAKKIAATTMPAKKTHEKTSSYSIEQQLRRVFQSVSGKNLVDAFAIASDQTTVTLLRVDNKKTIRIMLDSICKSDRYWVQRNREKIRKNGSAVQRLVWSNGDKLDP